MKFGKCRYADWRPNLHHQIKWVSSLVAVPSDLLLPLLKLSEVKTKIPNCLQRFKATEKVRSFTSLQMVHTHAPLPRGFFRIFLNTDFADQLAMLVTDHADQNAGERCKRNLFCTAALYLHTVIIVISRDLSSRCCTLGHHVGGNCQVSRELS